MRIRVQVQQKREWRLCSGLNRGDLDQRVRDETGKRNHDEPRRREHEDPSIYRLRGRSRTADPTCQQGSP